MLTGHDLTAEQRMLVHQAATRPDRVVCVVGMAGSGKTLALRALGDAYRGVDVTVLGAAPRGRAADELEAATGIGSRTLHRLLLDARRDGGLPRGCVLIVDEAGMAAPAERTARALQRPAAEPLALDQRRERGDTILNLLVQRQEELDRHRKRTVEQLATARRELEHLHWWNRARRAELEDEISLHQEAPERADAKSEQLRQHAERRSRSLALVRERDELSASLEPEGARRSPAMKLEREPLALGLEL